MNKKYNLDFLGVNESARFLEGFFSSSISKRCHVFISSNGVNLDTQKVKNILPNGDYPEAGDGTNINDDTLYVYRGISIDDPRGSTLGLIADTSNWLIRNEGNPKTIRVGSLDQIMYKFLKKAGLKVE